MLIILEQRKPLNDLTMQQNIQDYLIQTFPKVQSFVTLKRDIQNGGLSLRIKFGKELLKILVHITIGKY